MAICVSLSKLFQSGTAKKLFLYRLLFHFGANWIKIQEFVHNAVNINSTGLAADWTC